MNAVKLQKPGENYPETSFLLKQKKGIECMRKR